MNDDTTGSEVYWADKPHWHWQTYKEDLAVRPGLSWDVGGDFRHTWAHAPGVLLHIGTHDARLTLAEGDTPYGLWATASSTACGTRQGLVLEMACGQSRYSGPPRLVA